MNEPYSTTIALTAGFGAGLAFFGGLWLTVRRLSSSRHPALLIILSSLGRMAMAVLVFWWLARTGLYGVAWGMAGFLGARFLLIRSVRAGADPGQTPATTENRESWN